MARTNCGLQAGQDVSLGVAARDWRWERERAQREEYEPSWTEEERHVKAQDGPKETKLNYFPRVGKIIFAENGDHWSLI